MKEPRITREWAMPNSATFSIPPIRAFLARWLCEGMVTVDPFCGESRVATHRNDLVDGVDARAFLRSMAAQNVRADAVILDPPYSPTQVARAYKGIGKAAQKTDTQTAALYRECKDLMAALLRPGGIALTFGWNSMGFGTTRGFEKLEILLVAHGAAHNDTICVAEQLSVAVPS